MPRRPRVFVEGGFYHVDNRFARGVEIFAEGTPEIHGACLTIYADALTNDADQVLNVG